MERETTTEKLGLTLYYSSAPAPPPPHHTPANQDEGVVEGEDEGGGQQQGGGGEDDVEGGEGEGVCVGEYKGVVTEVLVSQIEPGTVASKDGRLRIGDQILQVSLRWTCIQT